MQIVSTSLSLDDYDTSSFANVGREYCIATQAWKEQPINDDRSEQIPSYDQQQAIGPICARLG